MEILLPIFILETIYNSVFLINTNKLFCIFKIENLIPIIFINTLSLGWNYIAKSYNNFKYVLFYFY